jgi:hypothetical protein
MAETPGDGATLDLSAFIRDMRSMVVELEDMGHLGDMPGLTKCDPITLEGTWDTADYPLVPRTASAVFDPSGLRAFPRKLKKAMTKFVAGRPLGRRERARIVIPICIVR